MSLSDSVTPTMVSCSKHWWYKFCRLLHHLCGLWVVWQENLLGEFKGHKPHAQSKFILTSLFPSFTKPRCDTSKETCYANLFYNFSTIEINIIVVVVVVVVVIIIIVLTCLIESREVICQLNLKKSKLTPVDLLRANIIWEVPVLFWKANWNSSVFSSVVILIPKSWYPNECQLFSSCQIVWNIVICVT